jgi:acetyl-CoA carboxylase biotin carboxyl carrier protein
MDEKTILALLDKFDAGNTAELDFYDGTARLILRKEGAVTRNPPARAAQHPAGVSAHGGLPDTGAVHLGLPVNAPREAPDRGGELITSPIVATFYASPGPDAPPFVNPGSLVKAGDTLCILEAMKMMNHLEAEFDCEILAVRAGNGDLVEYGQVLFEVKRL